MLDNYQLIMNDLEKMKNRHVPASEWEGLANMYMQQRLSFAKMQSSVDQSIRIPNALEHYARFCFEEVVRQNPQNLQSWWELALIYTFSKTQANSVKAISCLMKCAELKPTNSSYWSQIRHIAQQNELLSKEQIDILREITLIACQIENEPVQDFSKLLKLSNLAHGVGMNVILRLANNTVMTFQSNFDSAFGLTPEEVLEYHLSSEKQQALIFNDYKSRVLLSRASFQNPNRHAMSAETPRSAPQI